MSGPSKASGDDQASCCPKNPSSVPVEIIMDESNDDYPSELNVDPKENLKLQPKKGILKQTSSFDNERKLSLSYNREAHFDEMNILATFHPADKDYGHMKVDEPKTPYHHHSDSETEEGTSECVRRVSLSEPPPELDPKALEERIMKKVQRSYPEADMEAGDDDGDEEESEDRAAKRKAFEMKRKQHYNEFAAVKLAKQLIEEDEKALHDDNKS